MIGARIFLPASSVGHIVDRGIDFPPAIQASLESYGPEMFYFRERTDGQRLTTRALNIYTGQRTGEGHQSFRYLTPKMQLFPFDIAASPLFRPIPPSYLHIVCSPGRAREIVDQVDEIATNGTGSDGFGKGWKPELIWEPFASSCVPEELPNILALAPRMKVLSPNHIEALSLFGITSSDNPPVLGLQILKATCDLARHVSPGSAVIIRSGATGACVCVKKVDGSFNTTFVSPYYGKDQQENVVDDTGGGNAFLGGLCAGLILSNGDVADATLYGMVSASFAIEQKGPPHLSIVDGKYELWNGDSPNERLMDLRRWSEEESSYNSE